MGSCSVCGAEAPEQARFCPSCGASLAKAPKTRKVVTVLFCDWVGSTPLGEGLDAESLRHVQEAFYAESRRTIERHGGVVEKFIGDAVMAVFGVPQAHEDDALRAVRAAVELRDALTALNERLERSRGIRFAVRTGINTGEVLASDPSSGQSFVTGESVVVAKRLEESAGAGVILIGETTRLLVRDAALVEAVEGLILKGKAAPVTAWRLRGVLAEARGFARRLDAPLVDRNLELQTLRRAFDRAENSRTGHFVTLLGPAGVGKSRLVNELLGEVGERTTILRGNCLPYGEGITFWPIVRMVREAAQIGRDLSPDTAKRQIAELVSDEPSGPTIVEHIAGAIGLSDAHSPSEETFWAIRKLLESLARRRPVVLSFDDVHWGEETFLDLVEYLADWTRDVPILLVCLARPELLDARPTWGGGKVNATSMLLDPLTRDESAELVDKLLPEGSVAEDAKRAIAAAAEGNPLFLEEILGMLLDKGDLREANGTWSIDDPGAIHVPPTIQAVLAERLDRLPPEERSVIETAAVMGRVFRQTGLAELTGDEAVTTRIDALVRKELIHPAAESWGESMFQFRHILIQDAAYRSIPKERRADVHERFASWLERTLGERARELEEIIGYHLEQAYRARAELGREDLALSARAASVLAAAGRRALARGDAPAARNLLQRAVTLPGSGEHERISRQLDLARAVREQGDLGAAERLLEEARAGTVSAADQRLEAQALVELCYLRFFTDPKRWMGEALPTADQAILILEEFDDDAGLADAWMLVVLYHYSRCRIAEMESALDPALFHATRGGHARQVSTLMNAMTRAALVGPQRVDDAIARCEAIAAEREHERSLEAVTLSVRALLEAMRRRPADARALYQHSHALLRELGQQRLLAALRNYSGAAELLAGDLDGAERELRAGAAALEEIGDRANLAPLAVLLAEVLELQGRQDEARSYAELSERIAPEGDLFTQIPLRIARARLEARRSDFAEATRLAEEAVALAAGTDHVAIQGDALLGLGDVLLASGKRVEAEEAIRQAIERYEAKGHLAGEARARKALERIAVEA